MRSVSILSIAALVAAVAAQPGVEKRDVVTITRTREVVKTVDVTSTVYVNPDEATEAPEPPAAPPKSPPQKPDDSDPKKHGHAHHRHQMHQPQPPKQPPAVPTPPPPSPSPPTPPPPPPPPKEQRPPPKVQRPPPPPKVQPKPPSSAPPESFSGDMTHYAPGLGSCGLTSSAAEAVVALAEDMMNNGINPNANPKCGQTITISYAGQTHTAKIVDTCVGCATEDIDLSPTLFKEVAPAGDGRVPNVKWWFNN